MIADRDQKFTRLTLERPDMKIVFERPLTDVDEMELVETFFTFMIGIGFTPESVYECMDCFLADYAPELMDIHAFDEIDPSQDR